MKHRNRDYSLDNLRSFLTALVIIHHTAVCYGGFGFGTTNWATQLVLIYWNSWTDGRGIKGPVWYLGLLFIFDTLSMVAAPCRNHARTGPRISSSFAIRIFYPIGTTFPILSIQPGYLLIYVFAYIGGRLSVIYGDVLLLDVSPLRCGPKPQLALSAVFQLIGLGVIILTVRTGLESDDGLLQLLTGGLNLPALLYAAWNELGLALVGSSLTALFANHIDFPIYLDYACPRVYPGQDGMAGDKVKSDAKPRPLIARYSYAAFLVHPLVSLAVEILDDGMCDDAQFPIWKLLGPVLLTIIVGAVNVAASWAVACLICHCIPGLGRIL